MCFFLSQYCQTDLGANADAHSYVAHVDVQEDITLPVSDSPPRPPTASSSVTHKQKIIYHMKTYLISLINTP